MPRLPRSLTSRDSARLSSFPRFRESELRAFPVIRASGARSFFNFKTKIEPSVDLQDVCTHLKDFQMTKILCYLLQYNIRARRLGKRERKEPSHRPDCPSSAQTAGVCPAGSSHTPFQLRSSHPCSCVVRGARQVGRPVRELNLQRKAIARPFAVHHARGVMLPQLPGEQGRFGASAC